MELAKWKWVFPEAVRCWGVCLQCRQNEVLVRLRYETDRNEMATKWNAFTASTWTNNSTYFIYCTTIGWWGIIEDIARSALQITSCWKELDFCPHILKTFYNLHCCRKLTYNENYIWFSGHYFRVGGTPKNAPLRCIKLTALPERRLMGWTRRSRKKYTIGNALERGMGGDWMKRNNGLGNEWSFTGCLCVDIFVRGLQPISEMEWLRGFVEWNEEATYAVRCWGGWNELNAM